MAVVSCIYSKLQQWAKSLEYGNCSSCRQNIQIQQQFHIVAVDFKDVHHYPKMSVASIVGKISCIQLQSQLQEKCPVFSIRIKCIQQQFQMYTAVVSCSRSDKLPSTETPHCHCRLWLNLESGHTQLENGEKRNVQRAQCRGCVNQWSEKMYLASPECRVECHMSVSLPLLCKNTPTSKHELSCHIPLNYLAQKSKWNETWCVSCI